MPDLYIYNSLTKRKEKFVPINPPKVGLYTCGPTVYNYAHIGNLRTYVFNDTLHRTLLYLGYKVTRVMNITDVGHLIGDGDMGDDKVEEMARERKMDAWELSEFYTKAFKNDMLRLNLLPPDIWEKATSTINEQIDMIRKLEERGYTYKTSDGIYFDTTKFKKYGSMSSLDKKGMIEGARVDYNPERRNPADFALWKFNTTGKKRQMEWDSPWGRGFPGWHIECSAISTKHLGNPFDIHTGGVDHKEIHHPNEIAQTECATGKKMANYWMHGAFLTVGKGKMAKSKGDFLILDSIVERGFDPLVYKYYLFQAHYRTRLNFEWEELDSSKRALERLRSYIRQAEEAEDVDERVNTEGWSRDKSITDHEARSEEFKARWAKGFMEAVMDDLNIPKALAVMWEMIREAKKIGGLEAESLALLFDWDSILGLNFKRERGEGKRKIPSRITALLKERETARRKGDFKRADKIRKTIEKGGYRIKDTDKGTELEERE